MNRFFYGFLAFLFLFLSIYPFSNVFADNDLVITGTPVPVQGDITDDQLKDIIVAGITADLVSQGYSIDLSASDGDWDNFKNAVLDYIFNSAASGSGFWGEIYNSALYHNLIDENFTLWYPDTSDGSILPGISKRSIYRNLSENFINNILDSRSDDGSTPSPTPQPSPDFSFIQNINNLFIPNTNINLTQYTGLYRFQNYNSEIYTPTFNLGNCTIVQYGGGFSNNRSHLPESTSIPYVYFCNPCITINVDSSNPNNVTCIYSATNKDFANFHNAGNTPLYGILFSTYADNYVIINDATYSANNDLFRTSFNSLSTCINYLYGTFCNINLYVDGVLWALAYDEPVLPTINISPGYVLQGTDYPLQYNFPDPPSFDYQRMIDIIKHALLQYGVIQWEDIADVFVDVNGQTAVAILEIHRNDYDVLYDEQYPGIALPNRFNTHLLDTSHQYLSPVVHTVEETTGILPGEIKGALAIGMMLTIFACLIHRLLE